MSQPATSPRLWAPVHTPKRGRPYINWTCIAYTRTESKQLLLKYVKPERQAEILKRVRFARITISEFVPAPTIAGHTSKGTP